MFARFTAKQRLMVGTVLAGAAVFFGSTPAFADCLPDVAGTTVICNTTDPDGFQTTTNSVTIRVQPLTTVGTGAATPSPLLSAGTTSILNNEGLINSGATAVSLGGGSTVNNAAGGGSGDIIGNVLFGNTTGTQVNVFNNLGGTASLTGSITSTGALTVNSGAGSIITGSITATTGPLIVVNNGGTIGGAITGSGVADSVTISGGGTIGGAVALGAGDDTFSVGTGTTYTGNIDLDGGNNTLTNAGTLNGNVAAAAGNDTVTNSGALNGSVNLGDGNNTITNSGPIIGNITTGTGNDTLTNTAPGTVTGNINLGTGTDGISGLAGAGTVTKAGAGTLTLSGNNTGFSNVGTVLNINGGGMVAVGASNNMFTGGIAMDSGTLQTTGAATLTNVITLGAGGGAVQSDAATTLSGNISGAGGLTKTGTADLTLSGANTFAGPATVNNGKLILSGGAAIGDTTAVILNTSSTTAGSLQVNNAETIGSLAGSGNVILNAGLTTGGDNTSTTESGIISGTGSLTKNGTGTFTITGANTYSGGTTVNNGTLAGNSTSLQGNILVNVPGILLFNQTANGTYAGALTGAGTFTKAGAGVLTLSGNNSGFTGTSNLNGGTIAIGAANNIGVGPLVFDGGTLQTTGPLTLANAITLNAGGGTVQTDAATTLSGIIGGAGGLTKTGTANLTLTGANTYGGGTTVSAGTLTGTTTSLQGAIVDNAAIVFDQTTSGTYAGNLSGTGTVTKSNTGTVTFTGNNTYSGATAINGGTLIVGPTGIGDSSAVTVASGATLQLGANETIGSLAGAGALTGAFTLTTGGNNSSTTFSGPVTSTGITKVGTGTFTLSGTGTSAGLVANGGTLALGGAFTAPATVGNGGTLSILSGGGALTGSVTAAAGSNTIVNGSVTGAVTNAGTLSGTGTVTGAVTNTGTLAPGNSGVGIFHVVNGPFTQSAAGTLQMDVNAAATPVAGTNFDQLLITGAPGTAVLAGTLQLQPATGLYVNGANYDVIDAVGGITGTLNLTGVPTQGFITFTNATANGGGIVTIAGAHQVYRVRVIRALFNTAATNPNQVAVANAFQNLIPGATGDAQTVLVALDGMNAAQAQQFFDETSPEPYGAYARALLNQGELFSRQIHLQTHENPNLLPGFDLWLRGYGGWGNGKHDDFRFGSDIDTWGIAGGATYRWTNFYVGGALGWSKDKIDYELGNSDGHNKSWQAGLYGGWQGGPWSADLQVDYIHGSMNASRSINVASIARIADGSTKGHSWKVVGTAGYDFALGGIGALRPFIGFDWTTGHLNAFTETGANALNLTVDKIDAKRFDGLIGLDLKSNPNSQISPYARLMYRYDFNNHDNDIDAVFNGNPATLFTVSAEKSRRSEIDADLGVNFQASPQLAIYAGYQGTWRKDLKQHGFSAGVSYSFGAPPPPPAPPSAPPPPPPPPPATQTCPDGTVIEATATCPAPPPPPPPPLPAPERGN